MALTIYSARQIVAEDFALGKGNTHTQESYNGVNFTSGGVDEIKSISHLARRTQGKRWILWLGNSQLHTLNQYRSGDHLAPYWLRTSSGDAEHNIPLGFSLPNASLQEHYVLHRYVSGEIPLSAVIIELCFDDTREDGLRADFGDILDARLRARVSTDEVGRELLAGFDSSPKNSQQDDLGLEGFGQRNLEQQTTDALGKLWPLWAERANLRGTLLTDLYFARNWLLGIKATSVRKIIPLRYQRNMRALQALLADSQREKIPLIAYIAPIRQDHSIPYDLAQYNAWKNEVKLLAAKYGAVLLNLEELVPPEHWGTYHEDDIDFMHFQGEGHKLLATALLPYVRPALRVQ